MDFCLKPINTLNNSKIKNTIIMAKVKISPSTNASSDVVAASSSAVKLAYDKAQTAINRFEVASITSVNELQTKQNGWYSISSATIAGVNGSWIISKFGTLYTATSTKDPRVVLNSTNLLEWYSPYGSWHI